MVVTAPVPIRSAGERVDPAAARRRAAFRSVLTETYPSVAAHVIGMAEAGPDHDLDDWLLVARLLYDDLVHRSRGLSAAAREQALRATVLRALEAQARSSARLAGWADHQLDDESTLEGDPPGTLVWEHYLCQEAKLVRQSLHGEALGDWLSALGELWEAADAYHRLHARTVPPAPRTPPVAEGAAGTSGTVPGPGEADEATVPMVGDPEGTADAEIVDGEPDGPADGGGTGRDDECDECEELELAEVVEDEAPAGRAEPPRGQVAVGAGPRGGGAALDRPAPSAADARERLDPVMTAVARLSTPGPPGAPGLGSRPPDTDRGPEPAPDADGDGGPGPATVLDERTRAELRLKAALARVEELSLW